ncbi:MAG: hypothetical protein HQL82_10770 [Magnetococcales bacterium]|nr:hypothetical protein [Magnetococcales bacterium]
MAAENNKEMADKSKPWTIRDIPEETRRLVQEAAHREGMTLSRWVARTLRHHAVETLDGTPALPTRNDPMQQMILEQLFWMRQRLEHLEGCQEASHPSGF